MKKVKPKSSSSIEMVPCQLCGHEFDPIKLNSTFHCEDCLSAAFNPPTKDRSARLILVQVPTRAYHAWLRRQIKTTPPNPVTGQPYSEAHFRRVAFALGMAATDTELVLPPPLNPNLNLNRNPRPRARAQKGGAPRT